MNKQNGKAIEQVECGICGAEHSIKAWDSVLCGCKTRIFSTPELQANVKALEAKLLSVKADLGEITRELHYRQNRRIMKDTSGKPISDAEWWANVHGKPQEVAVTKQAKATRAKAKGREELL